MQPKEMAEMVGNNPDLAAKMKDDPVGTLQTLSAMPLRTDVWIYRAAVLSLGLVSVVAVLGSMIIAFYGKTIPEGVFVMAGTGFGALAALLKAPDRG